MMIKSLHCVKIKVRELSTYDGLTMVDEFLRKFKNAVLEQQRFNALKWALHATPPQWWGTHQGTFEDWHGCRRRMFLHFRKPQP